MKFILHVLGAVYVSLAVFSAMAGVQSLDEAPKDIAMVQQAVGVVESNSRLSWSPEDFELEVWTSDSCHWCIRFKGEWPKLREIGYKIKERRNEPPPRGLKGYPTTYVKYTYKGKERTLTTIVGYSTADKVDKLIKEKMKNLPLS